MLVVCPRMMVGKEENTRMKTKHAGVDAGLDEMEG